MLTLKGFPYDVNMENPFWSFPLEQPYQLRPELPSTQRNSLKNVFMIQFIVTLLWRTIRYKHVLQQRQQKFSSIQLFISYVIFSYLKIRSTK
jgi:hypothetical protein